MKKNSLKKLIFKNLNYFIVFIIFIVAFFYGKNLQLSQEQINLRQYFDLLKKQQDELYEISNDKDSVEIENISPLSQGKYYRLVFKSKSASDLTAALVPGIKLGEEQISQSNLGVYLKSDFGNLQQIGQITLTNDNHYQFKEIAFLSNFDSHELIIKKQNENDRSSVEIRNISAHELKCSDESCFNNLAPTIKLEKEIELSQSFEDKDDVIFSRINNGHFYGQLFQAKNDNMAYVDLAIDVKGSGGLGKYKITLHKAIKESEQFKISEYYEAVVNFETYDLTKYQIESGVYRFPLAAKLEQGGYYYIAISGNGAKSNLINKLEILGGKTSADHSEGCALINGQNTCHGNMFYRIYYYLGSNLGQNRVSGNAYFEYLGHNQANYNYRFSKTYADFLDIESMTRPQGAVIYFDDVSGGISASSLSGTSFVYLFDTIYAYSEFYLRAEEFGGNFNQADFYYSYDNRNWQKVESPNQNILKNMTELNLTGDGKNHTVYLKITYKNDQNPIKLFNLKDLQIRAKINL